MIPYWPEPEWQVGPYTVYAFGTMLLAAVAVGVAVFIWRAKRLGLSGRAAWGMVATVVPLGFLGSHLMYAAVENHEALLHFAGISSFGGIVFGLVGLGLCLYATGARGDEAWKWFDAMTWAAVPAALMARVGCFLAHDHIGVRTSSWIAVQFPGGARYDLALLELLFLTALLGTMLAAQKTRWAGRAGHVFAGVAVSYGIFRLALDHLREQPARHFGLTAEQIGALALLAAGAAGLWRLREEGRTGPSRATDPVP